LKLPSDITTRTTTDPGIQTAWLRDDIPVGARIIMIADTIDAMTTDRPTGRLSRSAGL